MPAARTTKKNEKRSTPSTKKKSVTTKKKSVTAKKKSVAAKKKSVAAKKKSVTAKKAPAADAVHGSQAAFVRYLSFARAIPAAQVLPMRFDPELALHNVRLGVRAIELHRQRLQAELPRLDLARVFDLSDLAQALLFASSQAQKDAASATPAGPTLRELLQQGQRLRAQLLAAADTLAAFDLVPAGGVEAIRSGRGSIDAARDLGDLAALYHKHSNAFRQHTPVTAPQVKRAAELGAELLTRLSPGGARRGPRPVTDAVADRDRLATLLVLTHRDLRRAGYYLWGDAFDAYVPLLQSRVRPQRKAAPAPAPTPPAP